MKTRIITKERIIAAVAIAAGAIVISHFVNFDARYRVLKRDVFSQEAGVETIVYTEFGYTKDINSRTYSLAYPQVFVFTASDNLLFKRAIRSNEGFLGTQNKLLDPAVTNQLEGITSADYFSAKPVRYQDLSELMRKYLPVPYKPMGDSRYGK